MKHCNHFRYADWKRTKAERLHPSGDGRCTFPIKEPTLPAAYYFLSGYKPYGGGINRRNEFDEHCPTWAPIPAGDTP